MYYMQLFVNRDLTARFKKNSTQPLSSVQLMTQWINIDVTCWSLLKKKKKMLIMYLILQKYQNSFQSLMFSEY